MLSLPLLVRSVQQQVSAALRWHLAPFHRPSPPPWLGYLADIFVADADAGTDPPKYSYGFHGDLRYRTDSIPELVHTFLWDTNASIRARVSDFMLLHAAAVTIDGGALLMPASMDSGKSSLALALVEAGCGYLSDEFGAIDPISNRVYPLERPISIGQSTLRFFPTLEGRLSEPLLDMPWPDFLPKTRYVRPEDVGGSVGPPAQARWLVFPATPSEGPARLTPISRSEAVERMARSSFNLHKYQNRGAILLARVAEAAQAFRLEGGTPTDRASVLLEELG